TVTVSDGQGGSTTATVSIGVTPVNDAPVASDVTLSTNEDTPIDGAIAASDADGDDLSYALGTGPANGTVVLNADGTFTYTPDANYTANDSSTVTVSDGHGGSTTVTVSIGVVPVNDAPVAVDDSYASDFLAGLRGEYYGYNDTGSNADGGN